MKPSTLKSGHDQFEEALRIGINSVCKKLFDSWELDENRGDWMDLLTNINAGVAIMARELTKRFPIEKDN